MKTKLVCALAALFGACASTPQAALTPEQLITAGTWTCTSLSDGLKVVGKQTYASGGASKIDVVLAGDPTGQGDPIEITASGVGVWKLSETVFDEHLTRLTITSAKVGGQVFPAENFQAPMDEAMVNQPLTMTVTTLTSTHFDGVDPQGVVTKCLR
jgi:hypothetical protein